MLDQNQQIELTKELVKTWRETTELSDYSAMIALSAIWQEPCATEAQMSYIEGIGLGLELMARTLLAESGV